MRSDGRAQRGVYFNPRPPWGGRPENGRLVNLSLYIFQSTPSVGRATKCKHDVLVVDFLFQSTPSVGRATLSDPASLNAIIISIHALRGEGDRRENSLRQEYDDFNPRPPWGGRPFKRFAVASSSPGFQSTPSVGRATVRRKKNPQSLNLFQSTPSVGRATTAALSYRLAATISIHALRGEGDHIPLPMFVRRSLFQSTPSVGRATQISKPDGTTIEFQSTPSVGRATLL